MVSVPPPPKGVTSFVLRLLLRHSKHLAVKRLNFQRNSQSSVLDHILEMIVKKRKTIDKIVIVHYRKAISNQTL